MEGPIAGQIHAGEGESWSKILLTLVKVMIIRLIKITEEYEPPATQTRSFPGHSKCFAGTQDEYERIRRLVKGSGAQWLLSVVED